MATVPCLRWEDLATPESAFLLVRFHSRRTTPAGMHTHDFAEVFWIEEGIARHRINGEEHLLTKGGIGFMRPDDCHQIVPVGRGSLLFFNLAFPDCLREALLQRHPQEVGPVWSGESPTPAVLSLPGEEIEALSASALALDAGPQTAFRLERMLLGLIARVLRLDEPTTQLSTTRGLPEWLQTALLQLRDPGVFTRGVEGLAQAAGRSPEHLARTTRGILDRTPTELVNDARMDWAARRLRQTNDKTTTLAFACGFSTTAQFYREFRKRYGTTPRDYRARFQALL